MVVNGGSLYGRRRSRRRRRQPGPDRRSRAATSAATSTATWSGATTKAARKPLPRHPGLQADRRRGEARHTRRTRRANGATSKSSRTSSTPPTAPKTTRPPAPNGSVVTAQQFFLTDTPCSSSGTTVAAEITGDHLLHNTLGTCASGPADRHDHRGPRRPAARRPAGSRPRRRTTRCSTTTPTTSTSSRRPTPTRACRSAATTPRLPLRPDRDHQPRVPGPSLGHRPDGDRLQHDRQGDARVLHPDAQRRALHRARSASTSSNGTKPDRPPVATDTLLTNTNRRTPYWTYSPQRKRRSGRGTHGPRCG